MSEIIDYNLSQFDDKDQSNFENFVIPYSESERLEELAARMRKISPTLMSAALTGISIESEVDK